jgi:predicted nuclease of predicted toxin-antitoxin system
MKFLADMGISPKTVAFLRTLDHDATHLQEQGLERLPDSAILAKAREEARILLTHDLDFGELIAASGACLPSVMFTQHAS